MSIASDMFDPNRFIVDPMKLSAEFWRRVELIDTKPMAEQVLSVFRHEATRRRFILMSDPPTVSDHTAPLDDELFPVHWDSGDWVDIYWIEGLVGIRRLKATGRSYEAVVHTFDVRHLTEKLKTHLLPVARAQSLDGGYGPIHGLIALWYDYAITQYYDQSEELSSTLEQYFHYPNMMQLKHYLHELLSRTNTRVEEYSFHRLIPQQTRLYLVYQRSV